MPKLKPLTLAIITDLQEDINNLLLLGSDEEVIRKLENLDTMQQILKMSANLIRKSLK